MWILYLLLVAYIMFPPNSRLGEHFSPSLNLDTHRCLEIHHGEPFDGRGPRVALS
jgi:hypothetical protein